MSTAGSQTHEMLERWLVRFSANPMAGLRLFCFPYAGAGASAYFPWVKHLHPGIELTAVQLPGRETRLSEAPLSRLNAIVPEVVQAIRSHVDRPYAFFGHSVGALIAFQVARHLRRECHPGPVHLFVSARRAPNCPERFHGIHKLPDGQFVDELRRRWDGIPAAVLGEPELLQLLLPALRADLAVIETYTHVEEPPLDCPISAFGGADDFSIERDELMAWSQHTTSAFRLRMLPGKHFFMRTQHETVVRAVVEDLRPVLDACQCRQPVLT